MVSFEELISPTKPVQAQISIVPAGIVKLGNETSIEPQGGNVPVHMNVLVVPGVTEYVIGNVV
jgi:hypothetical protein